MQKQGTYNIQLIAIILFSLYSSEGLSSEMSNKQRKQLKSKLENMQVNLIKDRLEMRKELKNKFYLHPAPKKQLNTTAKISNI